MSLISQGVPSRTTGSRIPLYVSPSVRGALEQLSVLLDDYHYSPHCRGRILAYTAAHGTPTGCPELDREDEPDAEMVFVESLEPVDLTSEAWDRDRGVLFDAEMLATESHPWPIPIDYDAGSPPIPDPLPENFRSPEDWEFLRRLDREPECRYGWE